MNLIDENEELEQAASKKKIIKYIILSIVVLVVIAVVIVVFSSIKKKNTLKLVVDGKNQQLTSGLILMKDKKNIYFENNQMYLSAKKLSHLLNVTYNNDEYKVKGEDVTKCHIKTGNEYTSFISNSPIIYKTVIYDEEQYNLTSDINNSASSYSNKKDDATKKTYTEYEYFNIENGVKYINDEIYLSLSAIRLGFNIDIGYSEKTKTLSINTISKLESIASEKVSNAVIGEECDYYNKKLLKYGLVLIKNGENNYGIVSYNNYEPGSYVLSCNYSKVRFSEGNSVLTVVSAKDNKQGVFSLDLVNQRANVMIEAKYDAIRLIDEDLSLYLVKESGRYGVIKLSTDNKIDVVLQSEYQAIGIDNSVYTEVTNKYILDGKYIPIKSDNGWGLATTSGKIKIIPQYAEIGCNLEQVATGNLAIVLPNLIYNVPGIVFLTDVEHKYYNVLNAETGIKICNFNATEIYSKFESDSRVYYMKAVTVTGTPINDINIYTFFGKKEQNNSTANNTQNNDNKPTTAQDNNGQNNNQNSTQNGNNQNNNNTQNSNTQNNNTQNNSNTNNVNTNQNNVAQNNNNNNNATQNNNISGIQDATNVIQNNQINTIAPAA